MSEFYGYSNPTNISNSIVEKKLSYYKSGFLKNAKRLKIICRDLITRIFILKIVGRMFK